jgi:hypothetical protein
MNVGRALAISLSCAVGMLCGCGGSGSAGPDIGPLSGTINTDNFVIPEGQTRTAVGDVRVISSGAIDIRGTLLIKDGVNVALFAGEDLNITGNVAGIPSEARARSREGEGDVVFVGTGRNVNIKGTATPPPGHDVALGTSSTGQITISGSIRTSDGRNGLTRGKAGENGGSIHIGSPSAKVIAAEHGQTEFLTPVKVVVDATLRTGMGGRGGGDESGEVGENILFLTPGDGGIGGDIFIGADRIVIRPGIDLITGRGGDGGNASGDARDGTLPGEAGQSVVVRQGDPGTGGYVSFIGDTPASQAHWVYGEGGVRGTLNIHVGNGGPGGKGGSIAIYSERPGWGGKPRQLRPVEEWPTARLTGGNGGNSSSPSASGGDSGALALHINNAEMERFPIRVLVLENAFSGGAGFNGCAESPETAGTNGGDAVNATLARVPFEVTGRAFSGGVGGDGNVLAGGPGPGGKAASDEDGKKLGQDGADGKPCGSEHSSIQFIPGFDGDRYVTVRALSNAGHVLFESRATENATTKKTGIYHDGTITAVLAPSGYLGFTLYDINSSGVAVGQAFPSVGLPYAARYELGNWSPILPASGESTMATEINDIGDIVYGIGTESMIGRPYLLRSGEHIPIGQVGGVYPEIKSMSESSNLAGYAGNYAWALLNQSTVRSLMPLSGFSSARAYGINSNGRAVGASIQGSSRAPTLWISTSTIPYVLPTGYSGVARSINDSNIAVGTEYTSPGVNERAVLYHLSQRHVLQDYFDIRGALLLSGEFINSECQVAGQARTENNLLIGYIGKYTIP